jgi:23S rRNA (cytosine1962-C5)-methyltransferase
MILADGWKDYEILATGGGEKLESWAGVKLLRPDPQIIWPASRDLKSEKGLAARYIRDASGGGRWERLGELPDEWNVSYKDLTFGIRPTGFKHTGLFPEQAANWDAMRALIRPRIGKTPVRVLNLFAYTGGATVACAKEGAFVTHVDAAKGMVDRAKGNCRLSGVGEKSVRWIVEDCKKFLERETRRGQTYDAVVMDPPSYGRAPGGEVWKLEDGLFELVKLAAGVLSPDPVFVLLNSYTTGLGAAVMQNILSLGLKGRGGAVKAYELALPTKEKGIVLPCGHSALWTN